MCMIHTKTIEWPTHLSFSTCQLQMNRRICYLHEMGLLVVLLLLKLLQLGMIPRRRAMVLGGVERRWVVLAASRDRRQLEVE